MKRLTDLQAAGYTVYAKLDLDKRGGRGGNAFEVKADSQERFIDDSATSFAGPGKLVGPQSAQQAAEAIGRGDVVVLSAEDYPHEPVLRSFTKKQGELAHGGPGGYPYRPTVLELKESLTLSDLARQVTGHPQATWGIRPQVGSWPDHPELYLLVPTSSGGGATVAADDAARLVLGRLDTSSAQPVLGPDPTVRVEDNAVFIGGLRIDRRHYVIVAQR